MDGVAAKISAKAAKGRKGGLKPKTHHFFYVLVVICGWLAPPLAVAVRFGIGRDFFINVICTICGYFPGHFHNFYCQSIRNNKTAARTPKWAVKYGLVKLKDKRGGRHQWAGRYDERLPDSSRNEYADADSIDSSQQAGEWDGRGPEPANRPSRLGGNNLGGGGGKKHLGFHITSPWDNVVDEDEVQGNGRARRPEYDDPSVQAAAAKPYDPLDNEQFFESTSHAGEAPATYTGSSGGGRSMGSKLKAKGFLGKNRSRYEDASSSNSSSQSGDRFDKMNAARGGGGGGAGGRGGRSHQPADEYQDDFEREINGASRPSANNGRNNGSTTTSSAAQQRFDSFDQEGPENAWAQSSMRTGAGTARRTEEQQQPPRRSNPDGDLFNHTF